mmetsp:Transcript_54165/g.100044  ORF Transcript_54165/g.100044 Transcript_54165/m.100044 type:complete len:214 (+) Transcript_54165:613-1254(+)
MHSHEPCITTHELHDADTLGGTGSLHPAIPDNFRGGCNRRVKPEGLVKVQDIVVDRLWDSNNAHGQSFLLGSFRQQVPCILCSVAAHHEEHVYPQLPQVLAYSLAIKASSSCLEDTTSLHVDVPGILLSQSHRRIGQWVTQAIVPSFDAPNLLHAILGYKCAGDLSDDGVQPWAQTPGSDNCSLNLLGLPPDVVARIGPYTALGEFLSSLLGF